MTTVGLIGTGVIGTGWAVRALARGHTVIASDVAEGAEARFRAGIARAWPAARKLGLLPGADPTRVGWAESPAAVAAASDFIQENVPENPDIKAPVHRQLDAAARPEVIIASSSSGLLPSDMQAALQRPERFVVGHPFNPVYLLPLVEVVPGGDTSAGTVQRARDFYADLGMEPLVVRNEIEGYLSDRLQEAMWREILHLVNDGIATTEELDAAVTYGPGLRWAGMGTNLTFHLAGGDGGMRYMLEHFGPALELPWTKLEAPPLTPELIDRMATGAETQAAGRSIVELERLRDDYLVSVMRALRAHDIGAGRVMARHEARVHGADPAVWAEGASVAAPLRLYSCVVEPAWVDYNGHMTESAYLLAAGWASDKLFRYLGIDEDYRAAGHSYYTVETHIGFLGEASVDDPLDLVTTVLGADAKRLHFVHEITHAADQRRLATVEQMLLHVDTTAGRSAPVPPAVHQAVQAVVAAHARLESPATPTMGFR